jgi:hypothetical protein
MTIMFPEGWTEEYEEFEELCKTLGHEDEEENHE